MYFQWFQEQANQHDWLRKDFMLWNDHSYDYYWLIQQVEFFTQELKAHNIEHNRVCALCGDYSPYSVALLLALVNNKSIIVPISTEVEKKKDYYSVTSQAEYIFDFNDAGEFLIRRTDRAVTNPLLTDLKQQNASGLVLFTSGSTGDPKAALYNFDRLLNNYCKARKAMRSLVFLRFDHIGGINTLFSLISNGGTIVALADRNPSNICSLIEKYQVELFPTTPSFLNLLKVSEAYKEYDLSSLRMITYGTEVMPESLLKSLTHIFPDVDFKQTYGLTEIGILRSKSKGNDSAWVKVGGENHQTKIVDNVLWIKTDFAIYGYLNAPSPFTEDGWLITGDKVEVDGEFIKFLGREEEIINVGGLKVYPQEVEDVLLQLGNVTDAIVRGEAHPMLGHIVCAKIKLKSEEDLEYFRKRLYKFCIDKIEIYKIPQKITIVHDDLIGSERFKKIRREEVCEMKE